MLQWVPLFISQYSEINCISCCDNSVIIKVGNNKLFMALVALKMLMFKMCFFISSPIS